MSNVSGSQVPPPYQHVDVLRGSQRSSSSIGNQHRMNRASAKASRSTSLSEVTSISRFSESASDMGDPEKRILSREELALRAQDIKIEGLTMKRMATPDLEESREQVDSVGKEADSSGYPGPLALLLLTIGICLSVFLVSLDRTIVATVRKRCSSAWQH